VAPSRERMRLHLPPRTIRARLTVLVFAAFLAAGAVLLAVTVVVWLGRTGGPTAALPSPSGGVRVPATQHSVDRRELLVASGVALTVMGALSLGLGWLVAGRFLRPLRTITAAAREISATTLHERLNLSGPDDELTELADTFDELLVRLERSFASERRFVANASHELRTPLAGMRASLDVAMGKPGPVPAHVVTLAERLRRELDRMDALLESFLTLAKTQQGPLAEQATLSLAEIACVAIEDRAAAISAQGLNVEQQTDPHARVTGSAPLLARMVENVIENAIGHNQPEGWLRVCTAVEGTRAQLVVENGGERLDHDVVKELSRPFRRAGAERTGSDRGAGLGLAIVASIAEVHGGTLDLAARDEGGLRVAIGLPLAAGAAT
jgi:signal transduction histidine kinase